MGRMQEKLDHLKASVRGILRQYQIPRAILIVLPSTPFVRHRLDVHIVVVKSDDQLELRGL